MVIRFMHICMPIMSSNRSPSSSRLHHDVFIEHTNKRYRFINSNWCKEGMKMNGPNRVDSNGDSYTNRRSENRWSSISIFIACCEMMGRHHFSSGPWHNTVEGGVGLDSSMIGRLPYVGFLIDDINNGIKFSSIWTIHAFFFFF